MDYFGETTKQLISDIEDKGFNFSNECENPIEQYYSLLKTREDILANVPNEVKKNFKSILAVSGIKESSINVTCSNFFSRKKAVTRNNVIRYCFAAGMNDEETDLTLKKHFDYQGLHLRHYKDLIYAFFLKNNDTSNCVEQYTQAENTIKKYSAKYDAHEVNDKIDADQINYGELTDMYECEFQSIASYEQLINYLDGEKALAYSGSVNRTASGYYFIAAAEAIGKCIDRIGITIVVEKKDELFDKYYQDPQTLSNELIKLLNSILNPYRALIGNLVSKTNNDLHNILDDLTPLGEYYDLYDLYKASFDKDYENGAYDSIKLEKSTIYNRLLKNIFNIGYYISWNIDRSDIVKTGVYRDATEYTLTDQNNLKSNTAVSLLRSQSKLDTVSELHTELSTQYSVDRLNERKYTWAKSIILNDPDHIAYVQIKTIGELIVLLTLTSAISDSDNESSEKLGDITQQWQHNISEYIDTTSFIDKESKNRFDATNANTNIIKFLFYYNVACNLADAEGHSKAIADIKKLIQLINRNLTACKLPCLDPRIPFDYMLYVSLYQSDPFGFISKLIAKPADTTEQ